MNLRPTWTRTPTTFALILAGVLVLLGLLTRCSDEPAPEVATNNPPPAVINCDIYRIGSTRTLSGFPVPIEFDVREQLALPLHAFRLGEYRRIFVKSLELQPEPPVAYLAIWVQEEIIASFDPATGWALDSTVDLRPSFRNSGGILWVLDVSAHIIGELPNRDISFTYNIELLACP